MASGNSQRKSSKAHKHGGLKELPATAICGNDISSSVLYVSALAIIAGGKWAAVSLALVAAVLFLFRGIYAEVVGAHVRTRARFLTALLVAPHPLESIDYVKLSGFEWGIAAGLSEDPAK